MNRTKLNILLFLTLTVSAAAYVPSLPEQEYIREQQALEAGAIVGCFLILAFIAAVIVIPIILCILVVVLCVRKRRVI